MKAKTINTNFLTVALSGIKFKKAPRPQTLPYTPLLHTLMLNKRREMMTDAQPIYRSITAMIH